MMPQPNVICTKCKSSNVGIEQPPIQEIKGPKTMDEVVAEMTKPIPLIYRPIVYKCFDCGYSVSF